MKTQQNVWIGVDVAKEYLDVCVHETQEIRHQKNVASGRRALALWMAKRSPRGVIMEATGGWERAVVKAFRVAGLKVMVMNPRRVRDFAKAAGLLAKTDRIDAKALALFGAKMEPEPRPEATASEEAQRALLDRRRQLSELLTQERNRRELAHPNVRGDVNKHIRWIEKELQVLDEKIKKVVADDPVASAKQKCLQAVKGVGKLTSLALVAAVPELGKLDRQKIAALVGVAPFNCDSGTRRGQRHIFGGRALVRNLLYMATLAATKCNTVIKAYFNGLRARGKIFKVAMVACMRKLLTHLNSLMRQHLKVAALDPVPAA